MFQINIEEYNHNYTLKTKSNEASIFLLMTILCITNGLQAQLSEKFLKLNRVVVLDSVKSKYFITNGGSETVFSIVVPNGVYWKIESISFNPSADERFTSNLNLQNINEIRVKINSVDLTMRNSARNIDFHDGYSFLRTTPTWASPGSIIIMYVTKSTLIGKTLNFDMSLNAMEFIVE